MMTQIAWERMASQRAQGFRRDRPSLPGVDGPPGPKMRTGPSVRRTPGREAATPSATCGACRSLPPSPRSWPVPHPTSITHQALRVDPSWIERRHLGDVIDLIDTRGSHRELRVVEAAPERLVVEVWDTTYVETGTTLVCDGDTTPVGVLSPRPPVPRATRRRSRSPSPMAWNPPHPGVMGSPDAPESAAPSRPLSRRPRSASG